MKILISLTLSSILLLFSCSSFNLRNVRSGGSFRQDKARAKQNEARILHKREQERRQRELKNKILKLNKSINNYQKF